MKQLSREEVQQVAGNKIETPVVSGIKPFGAPEPLVSENPTLGELSSRLDHPSNVSYGGNTIIVPPYGRAQNINKKLLGALPYGVVFSPYKRT